MGPTNTLFVFEEETTDPFKLTQVSSYLQIKQVSVLITIVVIIIMFKRSTKGTKKIIFN